MFFPHNVLFPNVAIMNIHSNDKKNTKIPVLHLVTPNGIHEENLNTVAENNRIYFLVRLGINTFTI